jgi:hypothetical protein
MATTRLAGRPLAIIAALGLARIGFGFQIQSVGSLGPDLMALFHLDYAAAPSWRCRWACWAGASATAGWWAPAWR